MKRYVAWFCLLLFLAGCPEPPEQPINTVKPLDTGVVTAVKMNLKTDAELAASDIKVSAENHLLIMRGSVPNKAAKKRAEALARKVPRVKHVANHLEIKDY